MIGESVMYIKLAIIDNDVEYFGRLSDTFSNNYENKIEICFFTDESIALKNIKETRKFDIVLMNMDKDISSELPDYLVYGYLGDSNEIESYNGKIVINKYQNIDLIYRQLISLYSEKASSNIGFRNSHDYNCYKIAFVSVAGGVGTSTVASAFSMRMARQGKVVYLNLEDFDSTNNFFCADGNGNLKNIIFALKSKKTNLSLKIESEIKQSNEGVYFFDACDVALDKFSMCNREKIDLIRELSTKHNFNFVIADTNISLDENNLKLLNDFDKIILVSDGSTVANAKTYKFLNSLTIVEEINEDLSVSKKIDILYNQFSNKYSKLITDTHVSTVGGINKIKGLEPSELAKNISEYQVLDKIVGGQ